MIPAPNPFPVRLFTVVLACAALALSGCNGESGDNNDGAGSQQRPTTPANNGADTQSSSEAMRTVHSFRDAVLELDLETAMSFVQEGTPAHASVREGITTLEATGNPNLPEEMRQSIISIVTGGWRGATTELVLEEGGSAIVGVTKSNGDLVDVNLNLFEGRWLIVSPNDVILLR